MGFLLGPAVFNVLELHPLRELSLLESITEIALLIALFTVGIKMRVPIGDWRWSVPLRLATISMVLTILGVAFVAVVLLDFDWRLALVLGAVLAPTDPVLASDVQLRSAQDRDSLRFGLTGEGGLNDGTAFPFVLLGLGADGAPRTRLRRLALARRRSRVGHRGRTGNRLPRRHRRWRAACARCAPGGATRSIFDEFLLLGVIALSYGVALAAHALGFLAVFAAGLALRRADDIHANSTSAADKPPLTPSMLNVNEQLERIVEVAIVLLVGAMISTGYWSPDGPGARGDVVCRDPPARRVDRRARCGCRQRAARDCWLVRHPRHRLGVLRGVLRGLRTARRRGHGAALGGFHGDRRVHRPARHLGRRRSWSSIARAAGAGGAEVTVSDKP